MAGPSPLHVDQSSWGCVRVTGADRVRFLQGMCTADVAAIPEGGWARAAMLDAKGRVTSIFDIVRGADDLLLLCQPGLADKTRALLDRYAVADDVAFAVVDQPVHRVWGAPSSVWSAPPVLLPCPPPVASADAVEIRRVEAGMPRYGVDVDETRFPFESRLREAIDYRKGCYIGQEPVSRVQHQGRPNWDLLGLRIDGAAPAPVGATVVHPQRADAGTVTSSVVSPEYGPIALACVHKIAAEPGTRVTLGALTAVVCAVPFDTAPASG
jgi:folate-binding protein YgfZ